ncbi:MAG: hypothetical protein K2L32_04655 [Muribaculaceae bacterium]|nr:hypothetical protein [Muribaculaceae bacterium]
MMKTAQLIFSSGIAAVLLTVAGCASDGCLNNRNSIPLAGFYSSQTHEPVTVAAVTVAGDGAPGDSMLLNNEAASQVYLPFRANADEVTFGFSVAVDGGVMTDQLTFAYRTMPYFDNADCGAMYRYLITSVDFNGALIDSVGIVDSLVTNVETERIKIYFHGAPQ